MKLSLLYNSNGFQSHTLEEAALILAELGYDGLALTPDRFHLDPFRSGAGEVAAFKAKLRGHGLSLVLETGARFILDPRRKHFPALLTPGLGRQRAAFLERCIKLARDLEAAVVSFHSGAGPSGDRRTEAFELLAVEVEKLLQKAAEMDRILALEPEPGMFIESMEDFDRLVDLLPSPLADRLGLTLDVGHVHIIEKSPIPEVIQRYGGRIVNVHLDDAANGKHEHLPPGEGEIDFEPIIEALARLQKPIPLSVELSRHGFDAVNQAARAARFFRRWMRN